MQSERFVRHGAAPPQVARFMCWLSISWLAIVETGYRSTSGLMPTDAALRGLQLPHEG